MEFLALIPVWIAVSICYMASNRQNVIGKPINKTIGYSCSSVLVVLAISLMSMTYPMLSAMLASLVMLMCFLPIVAITGAYGEKRFTQVSGFILVFSTCFAVAGGGVAL